MSTMVVREGVGGLRGALPPTKEKFIHNLITIWNSIFILCHSVLYVASYSESTFSPLSILDSN